MGDFLVDGFNQLLGAPTLIHPKLKLRAIIY